MIHKEEETNIEEQEPTLTPEETPEELDEELEQDDQPEQEESQEKDINYKEELEKLENSHQPKRSEREKAIYTAKQIAKRLEDLGEDPNEVFGVKKISKQETKEVPSDNLDERFDFFEAKIEAKRIAKTQDEANLIMWYVKNKNLTVSDAHLLANKGRVSKFVSEQNRSNVNIETGSNATGRKSQSIPTLSAEEQEHLRRHGITQQKDGSWEGKKVRLVFNKSKRAWETLRK